MSVINSAKLALQFKKLYEKDDVFRIYLQCFEEMAYNFEIENRLIAEMTLVFKSEYDPENGIYNDLWCLPTKIISGLFLRLSVAT